MDILRDGANKSHMFNHDCDYRGNAIHYNKIMCCISVNEQKDSAFNLSLAAILGSGVYNFGELVRYIIMHALYLIIICIGLRNAPIVKLISRELAW